MLVQPFVENKRKFNWYRILAFWCWKAVGAEGQCLPLLSFQSFQAMLESFKAVGGRDPTTWVDLQSCVVVQLLLTRAVLWDMIVVASKGTFLTVTGWKLLQRDKARICCSFRTNDVSHDEALQSREPVCWNPSESSIILDLCTVWHCPAKVKRLLNQDWELTKLTFYSWKDLLTV